MNLTSTALALGLFILPVGDLQGLSSARLQDEVEDYEEIRERELGGLVARLREHAEWCKKSKLWLQRALAYEAVLQFAPDDEEAHRGLGHKKLKDGSWAEGKRPRPVDRSKRDLEEAETRRKAISEPFVTALQGFHEREGEELPAPVLVRLLADVLAVDPENAWARDLRNEVKHEGAWVMMEVANAAARREELLASADSLRAELEPAGSKELTSLEAGLELPFTAAIDRGGVRVVGTVAEEELHACSENLRIARTLLREDVGSQCAYSSDFTYFLLERPSEQAAFLSNHPMVDDADRAFFLALESATLKGARHFGSWSDSDARRLDVEHPCSDPL